MANKNKNNYLLIGIAVVAVIILLFFVFGKQYISFLPHDLDNGQGEPNIEIVCSFSENPDLSNSPTDAIKCKFRNYGSDGEQCFSIKEYKIINNQETFLDENTLCSGDISKDNYWSEYKYLYNSKSWENYNSQDLTGWACGISTEIDCLYENNIDRIGYIIKTSSD